MNLAFDLDETIVSTRKANLAAYRTIGIEPPENFWYTRWEEWCSPADHDRKQDALMKTLPKYGKLLPAYRILAACNGMILTNASERSVLTVLLVFPELRKFPLLHSLNYNQKIAWLQNSYPGVYWDDQANFIERVREETEWQTVNVSGL